SCRNTTSGSVSPTRRSRTNSTAACSTAFRSSAIRFRCPRNPTSRSNNGLARGGRRESDEARPSMANRSVLVAAGLLYAGVRVWLVRTEAHPPRRSRQARREWLAPASAGKGTATGSKTGEKEPAERTAPVSSKESHTEEVVSEPSTEKRQPDRAPAKRQGPK